MGSFRLRAALLAILVATGPVARANEYSDTTTGRTEEKDYGLPSDKAMTEKGKRIMQRFKEGRLSSAKKTDSRFSGYLEFHDANLDGIVDHDADDSKAGLEGRMTSLLPKGQSLAERAEESRKKANKGQCGKEEGTFNKQDGKRACFSPSGIVLDMGDAHGGAESNHRTLRLSKDAAKLSDEAGQEYGESAIRDIETMMKQEYGLTNKKVAAIDQLKSEAAWLEEQKANNLERSWKTLRAARLAGMDNAADTATGTEGADFMHEVDLMISKGATDDDVAEQIALNSSIQGQEFIKVANNWEVYDPNRSEHRLALQQAEDAKSREMAAGRTPDPKNEILQSFSDIKKNEQNLGADERAALHEMAKEQAAKGLEKNKTYQEDLAKIKNCMNKDVWCHNQNTADEANAQMAQANKGQAPDPKNEVKAYSEVQGDPGAVFQDTRELVTLKLHEAQSAPIDQIENLVTNYDFNRDTDPEYFKQLDALKKESAEMQKANAARGNNAHDASKQSVQEFYGIKQGVNDSYREEGTEDVSVSRGSALSGRPRAPAATSPSAPSGDRGNGRVPSGNGGMN